tara:strand:+ start:155 stop:502 length:348 start_codon:yes stop_codon:yes gene_type:complete
VLKLNFNSIKKEKKNKIINRKRASIFDILLDVRGLEDVRATFLSILISIRSLMMHPALLIKKAPIKKKKYHSILMVISLEIFVKANQDGHISNMNPIGLSNLIRSNKCLIFFGII